ncbi:hypothetical protein CIW52_01520 [Mycolicibacterium sp. P9-64]|nr:hypothetical protein CIW52_01520 [Mycolicibacterium sp. P9-64]
MRWDSERELRAPIRRLGRRDTDTTAATAAATTASGTTTGTTTVGGITTGTTTTMDVGTTTAHGVTVRHRRSGRPRPTCSGIRPARPGVSSGVRCGSRPTRDIAA